MSANLSTTDSTSSRWLRARDIAAKLRACARTIHRRARRDGWPVRRQGNRLLYSPPVSELPLQSEQDPAQSSPHALEITVTKRADMRRAQLRFEAIDEVGRLISAGTGHEAALRQVTDLFRFHISPQSLRRWREAYHNGDFDGLLDHRPGRSGRRPKEKERLD